MAERPSPRVMVSEYMDYATVHGVGRVKNSPYIALKVLWLLLVTGSLAVIGIQVTNLYGKWSSNPVSTTVSLKRPDVMTFPAVTICNTNPLQYSKVQGDAILYDVIVQTANQLNVSLDSFKSAVEGSSQSFNDNHTGTFFEDGDGLNVVGSAFKMIMATTPIAMLVDLSQSPDDFIVECQYAREACSSANFSVTRSYDFGLCYTFPPRIVRIDDISQYEVSAAGSDYGLELLLNVDDAEHVPFVATSAGVSVTVHDVERSVEPKQDDLQISTGVEANVAVSVSRHKRRNRPEFPCDDKNKFNDVKDCLADCLDMRIKRMCSCSRTTVFRNDTKTRKTQGRCHSVQDFRCILELQKRILKGAGNECSDCTVPCSQTLYKTVTSQTRWPVSQYVPLLPRSLGLADLPTSDKDSFIKNNLLYLRVFLGSMTYEMIEEEPSYSDENFVSDIGGQLGLWAGISVLSLCEIVELVLLAFEAFCKRRQLNSHVTPTEQKEEEVGTKDGLPFDNEKWYYADSTL